MKVQQSTKYDDPMSTIEVENIKLKKEVAILNDRIIELQRQVIKLLEEREQAPTTSRTANSNWVILVDNPKSANRDQ